MCPVGQAGDDSVALSSQRPPRATRKIFNKEFVVFTTYGLANGAKAPDLVNQLANDNPDFTANGAIKFATFGRYPLIEVIGQNTR